MNKKSLAVGLAAVFVLAAAGCGAQEKAEEGTGVAAEERQEEEPEVVSEDAPEAEEGTAEGTEEGAAEEPEAEQQAGVAILVYTSNEDATAFATTETEIASLSPEAVVGALISREALAEDVEVKSFSVKETDGKQSIELDMNSAYLTWVNNMGTSGEYFAVGCLGNTFLDAYGCEQIKITVEGNPLETGHAEYSGYLTKFE